MIKKQKYLIYIVIILAAGVGIYFWAKAAGKPGPYDDFAKCLKDKEAVFYGAFWCPHCQDQKELFGKSKKYLPYVECSTPDGKGQKEYCTQKNVQGYPLWEFSDGSRESGLQSLQVLADKTGCALPQT